MNFINPLIIIVNLNLYDSKITQKTLNQKKLEVDVCYKLSTTFIYSESRRKTTYIDTICINSIKHKEMSKSITNANYEDFKIVFLPITHTLAKHGSWWPNSDKDMAIEKNPP